MTTPNSTDSFPIAWSRPEHEQLSWRHERWHFPDPVGPLAFDFAGFIFENVTRAMQARGEPAAVRMEHLNSYVYVAFGPPREDDPTPLGTEVQPQRFENHAMWDSLWLPEIQRYLERWEAFDRGGASATELQAYLETSLEEMARCWEIHFRLAFGAGDLFALVTDALGWSEEEARDLVLGVESKSLEGDNALRELARLGGATPSVSRVFAEVPRSEILETLAADPAASGFIEAFDRYLGVFGKRSDNFHDVSLTTWTEDPDPVLAMLSVYLREGDENAAAAQEAAEAKRARAQERARAEFRERAPERLEEFERELAFGLRANQLNEDHNYWLDQQVMYWARMDMLAAGDLLASAGAIDQRDDVFMLSLAQVRDSLGADVDLRGDVAAARADLERWADADPPGSLGAPPPPAMEQMLSAMFGQTTATSVEGQVRGMSGSSGVVTGVARQIASLEEADRLEAGDVLVTETTSPPWTPLFGIAAAVVTDAGGPMSHVAIVAREYGIPAVVGSVNATKLIRDGQRVRVDGSEGTVDLLED